MTYKSVALNSFTPVSTPTIINGVAIDGYVDDQPVVLRKGRNGMLIPTTGTTLPLSMGTGVVTGHTDDGMLIVNVTEFDDEFMHVNASETEIYDAEGYVDMLNQCYRSSIECKRETFTRLYKSEITDTLSEKNLERMLQAFPMPLPTEIVIGFKGDYLKPTDSIIVKTVDRVQRLTKAEKARQRRLEIAQAKRLADALLGEDTDVPDDVQAELDSVFGSMDDEMFGE